MLVCLQADRPAAEQRDAQRLWKELCGDSRALSRSFFFRFRVDGGAWDGGADGLRLV